MNKKYNIWIYVLCYNEMRIIPFIIQYWEKYASHVVVYDNGSNDGSLEEFSKYSWIEIRHFETNNTFDDKTHIDLKNSIWKECKNNNVDFVQVSDLDEVLISKDFNSIFDEMKKGNYAIWFPVCFEIYTKEFPIYKQHSLLHESDVGFLYSKNMSKCILFDPNLVEDMNYIAGAHKCKPRPLKLRIYMSEKLKMLHIKNLGIDYIIKKYNEYSLRLSDMNKQRQWGIQYTYPEEKIKKDFLLNYKKAVFPSKFK